MSQLNNLEDIGQGQRSLRDTPSRASYANITSAK